MDYSDLLLDPTPIESSDDSFSPRFSLALGNRFEKGKNFELTAVLLLRSLVWYFRLLMKHMFKLCSPDILF